jgi:hypothetical protein
LEKEMSEQIKRRFILCLLAGLFVSLLTLVSQEPAQARPFRLGVLPDKGAKFGCGTCHVNPAGGGPRNPFGQDYEKLAIKAGEKYTQELGAMDSDKDGATNDEEFSAGTNPGDPASKPAR